MSKKQPKISDYVASSSVANKDRERIAFLEKEIAKHRNLYYNSQPEISDAKYDALEDELRALDPQNLLLRAIGKDSSELYSKREHILVMGSQDKVTTPEEFTKWAKKRNFSKFLVQFKLDGVSVELQYANGDLMHAVTRGDGKIGDDITANALKMKGVLPKLKINFTGAVRAEILLFRDEFEKKYKDMQNCRNAASGIVRRKDGVGSEDLRLIFYDAVSLTDHVKFLREIDKVNWMKEEGCPTIKTNLVSSIQEIIDLRERVMNEVRPTLEYEIDGLVLKSNLIDPEDAKRPRPENQIAFKFQAEEMETKLLDVEWSVSGHIYTPVAIVETVRLMGTNVSRASLANPNLIEDLKLKIGSEVVISKRGDIIPKIERVLKTPPDAKEILLPETCEVCGSKLVNEGTSLYCPNLECSKREYHRLLKWIDTLDIKHFSEKLMLRKLFESGKVIKIADLYALKASDLTQFEGVKETSAKKALDNLFKVKEISLEKFVAGFDIEDIGEKMIKRLVDAGFDSLDKIKNASKTDLMRVEGFAELTSEKLLKGFQDFYGDMLSLLDTDKVKIIGKVSNGKLKGLSFCFTGKLNSMSRTEAEKLVVEHGGEYKSTVVKGLSYLVTNETEQTTKFEKAQKQGTKIIDEECFLALLK